MVLDLVHNVCLLIALAVASHVLARRVRRNPALFAAFSGVLFGVIGIIGMMTPVHFAAGVIFDGRSIVLALAGLFGGPLTALVSALMCAVYRAVLGGAGAAAGVAVIVESAALGTVLHLLRQRDENWVSLPRLLGWGFVIHALMMGLQLLIPEVGVQAIKQIGPVIMILYPLGFALTAQVFLSFEHALENEDKLKEREALLREIAANFPNSYVSVIEKDLRVGFTSGGEFQKLGLDPQDFVGQSLDEVFGEHADQVGEEYRRAFDGQEREFELFVNGQHQLYHVVPLRDESDRVQRLLAVVQNISERKRAEEVLRYSETLHRSILMTAMNGFWLVDTTGRLLEVNESYCRMSGYSRDELLGMSITELEAFETAAQTREHMQHIMDHGRDRFETRQRCRDGSLIEVEVSAQYLSEKQRVVAFLRDVTARNRSEQVLRRSERLLRRAQEIAQLGTWDMDFETGRVIWTDESYRIFGVPPGTPITYEVFLDRVHPDDRGQVDAAWRNALGGGDYDIEHRVLADGREKWVREKADLERDAEGRVRRAVGFSQDISERKRAEEADRISRQRLAQLEAHARRTQHMESLGVLAGGVAHDFNNMLGAMVGYADLALDSAGDNSEVRDYLQQLVLAAERATEMIQQILTFSRRSESRKTPVDMEQLVPETLKLLRGMLPTTVTLHHQIVTELPPVLADATQIQQVIMNLCANANHAMPEGGRLELDLGLCRVAAGEDQLPLDLADGDYIHLSVRDSGVGIPPEIQERIFEPFFTTKEAGTGSGMGLATSHGIVTEHGGAITVDSEPGRGATFHVYLPTAEPVRGAEPTAPDSAPVGGSERVLLVDDDPAVLHMTAATLHKLGYRVSSFSNSVDALAAFKTAPARWDLVLTDQTMPDLDGVAILAAVRRRRPELPVVIMSGHSDKLTLDADGGIGADAVLRKPFRHHELAAAIRQALNGGCC